jgi:hypothetical protein
LIPTDHQFHDAIVKEFRDVVQHSVLKKWLYLPEATEDFETVASDIVEAVRMNDQRFGVEPKERVKRKSKKLFCRVIQRSAKNSNKHTPRHG